MTILTYEPPTTLTVAEELVQRGIDLLDENWPDENWRDGIDLDTLDIAECDKCVLGQLTGEYCKGMDVLFSVMGEPIEPNLFGFNAANYHQFEDLTAAWRRLL